MTSFLTRRDFVRGTVAASVAGLAVPGGTAASRSPDATDAARGVVPASRGARAERGAAPVPFELDETSIADLQAGMQSERWTAESITRLYLERMDAIDTSGPTLRSVLERNPDALAIAAERDAERRSGKLRGPLHGVPVLIKGNVDTADRMDSTAGSAALAGVRAPRDAFIVTRLREAGAILLGKTNLSEWANFRSTHSSSGWSGLGGQTRNPYALDRSPSGSSSGTGSAIAANLGAVGIGTETDGSITSPAACQGLVGIKPTIGMVSRSGIIPIAHSQDTAGPMTRTVTDAVLLLGAMSGMDARDGATAAQRAHAADLRAALVSGGLKGKRIGIPRKVYFGYHPATDAIAEQAILVLKDAGAVIIDHADLAGAGSYGDAEYEVLLYEFKSDMAVYLAARGHPNGMRTMADLIAFNAKDAAREMPIFAQEIMEMAEKKGPLSDAAYRKARGHCLVQSRTKGIDATMNRHGLDALMAPTNGPAWLIDHVNGDAGGGGSSTQPAAVAGYPSITVPAGQVRGLPVGMSFFGRAWSEPTLIQIALGFEQATRARKAPSFAERATGS